MTNNTPPPFVSVVTPVYNAEEFISECIESVLTQTYQNFEYLIVNNCSTDRTLEIIQKYADMDSRIRIHNNVTFLTSLQNQNYAMTLIPKNSKYCKVVHADDWLFPECISEMVKIAEKDKSIGIVGSFVLQGGFIYCNGLFTLSRKYKTQYPGEIFAGREVCYRDLLRTGFPSIFGNPTTILISSEIIINKLSNDNTFYDTEHFFMDEDICYQILSTYNFAFIYQVLSFMRISEKQFSSSFHRIQRHYGARFYLLSKYGKLYLEDQEFSSLMKSRLKEYHNFLKFNTLAKLNFRKHKKFWDFHLRYLRLSGFPVTITTLVKFGILRFIDIVFNPKRTFESLYKRLTG